MIQIDIEMPKRCEECPLCVDYDCIIHERITGEYYDGLNEQYAHCPLIMPSAQPELGKNTMPEQPKMDRLGVKTGETCTDVINRQAAMGDLLKRSKVERLILAKSLLEGVLNDITGMQNAVEMLECLYKRYDTYSSCTIDICNFKMSWSACLQPERRWDI